MSLDRREEEAEKWFRKAFAREGVCDIKALKKHIAIITGKELPSEEETGEPDYVAEIEWVTPGEEETEAKPVEEAKPKEMRITKAEEYGLVKIYVTRGSDNKLKIYVKPHSEVMKELRPALIFSVYDFDYVKYKNIGYIFIAEIEPDKLKEIKEYIRVKSGRKLTEIRTICVEVDHHECEYKYPDYKLIEPEVDMT